MTPKFVLNSLNSCDRGLSKPTNNKPIGVQVFMLDEWEVHLYTIIPSLCGMACLKPIVWFKHITSISFSLKTYVPGCTRANTLMSHATKYFTMTILYNMMFKKEQTLVAIGMMKQSYEFLLYAFDPSVKSAPIHKVNLYCKIGVTR